METLRLKWLKRALATDKFKFVALSAALIKILLHSDRIEPLHELMKLSDSRRSLRLVRLEGGALLVVEEIVRSLLLISFTFDDSSIKEAWPKTGRSKGHDTGLPYPQPPRGS